MKVGGAVVEPSTASIADIAESDYHVRFVPKADINSPGSNGSAPLRITRLGH